MRAVFLAILLILPLGATAEAIRDCDRAEGAIVERALQDAKDLTVKAAARVGPTPQFERWFGAYSQTNAEKVRASLKAIATAIRGASVTVICEPVGPQGCASDEYAFVYSDRPYLIHICPSFFDLPHLEALQPGARHSEFGTREGTIIHELSHFLHVAATEDHCYSRRECSLMARHDPARAIENADSYQYFTEDVTFFARQPLADKPPPAPRTDR